MGDRLKVGVIGCGLIAQVMHLHYLRELADRFEIAAICDVSDEVRAACAREYGVPEQYADWKDLVQRPLDAVLVLTSGSHAPIAVAASEAGKHVLVEKPMCFSVAEGRQMIAAAEAAGRVLMVGYNKRYDPAYVRVLDEVRALHDLRLLRITTLESPIPPYVQHYNLRRGGALPQAVLDGFAADDAARVDAAISDVDDVARWVYRNVLLDSLVHEFNAMRGVLGEPDALEFSDLRKTGVTLVFTYGDVQCVLVWVDLPSIARYSMEFAFYSPDRRVTLAFPSPFLRSMPTLLITEDGKAESPRSTVSEEVVSYQESFKQELIHFHECVTSGRRPTTSAEDALRDIALCEAAVEAQRTRRPLPHPTEPATAGSASRS